MSPKISIIIPVYNVAPFIIRCLDSCIHQTLKDIEIIIVDDCGSDDSIHIAKDYASKDNQIKIISNPQNLGTFHARIIGANNASGLYCMFVDGDDFLHPATCELCLQKAHIFKKHQKKLPDIIHFGLDFFPPNFKRKTPKIITKDLKNENILKNIFLDCPTPPWNVCGKLYKTELVNKASKKLDFADKKVSMAEDALQNFVITLLAKSSTGIKNKLYFYYENTTSITRQSTPQARDKKIADIDTIIHWLDILSSDKELNSHPYFYPAKYKMQDILRSVIVLEHRYDQTNTIIPAYLKACLKSLKHHHKWQTYARIIIFILSFSKIKL
ncbi:glycosyltransferase family 2 protein [Helicobacter sp. 11S02596-1]|uniref:glycosyltransferase family 2 protein n=1 Tax=Helicobacter sp. 11S02596-1 TaxID=1476194 RepID=UPI000BA52B2D|nr:glycosyltransferase family 2 protein [Helicobacter sp. 11S02596-1]PAF45202.1 hypothetical protein BJI48_01170 [Helicobacter sp. 11S02596-1]